MYKYVIYMLMIVMVATGCKKFVALDPSSNLSGNNFWQNAEDVEAFTNGMYQQLRLCFTRPNLQAGAETAVYPYFNFSGDLRGAPIIRNPNQSDRSYIDFLKNNDL